MKQSFLATVDAGETPAGTRTPQLFDSQLLGFLAWGDGGRLMAANLELCRMTGLERKALEHGSTTVHELIPGIAWGSVAIQEVTLRRGERDVTLRVEVDADRRQAFLVDITPQHAAEQALANARDLLEAYAANITGTDIALLGPSRRLHEAQTRIERQQIEIEELLDRVAATHHELEAFSYSVSHDLRAPLRALDGFSRELMERYSPTLDTTAQRYLGRIRAGAQKLDQIIDDLLRLSRVSRTPLRTVTTDLTPLARSIAAELSASSTRDVQWIFPDDPLTVDADPELIGLALQNLLHNAWKFTSRRDRGVIELLVDNTTPSGRVFSVRDNGAGFDMQYADKLFTPFQRLHSTTSFEGTGIGLATVQRIIHRHGGQVWAEASPDAGATFSFTLGRRAQGKP
jgi:signal transduction histidine kinase